MDFLTMPAPIPINRNAPQMDSFSSSRPGGLTPKQASYLGGTSYKEPMAISFGKDVSEIMDYSISRFSTSTESDITVAPSSTRLESTFCRNFTCCGQKLDDLHDLLQHYEECHVKFEDDEMPAMINDDDVESSASSSETASQPPSPRTATALATGAQNATAGPSTQNKVKPTLQNTDSFETTSAFDTAVMRSPSMSKGKKRSFGQYANNANGSSSAIHQSLRRALIDGGVGRRTPGQPNIYAPNSPFSTPGSSIPGTPSCESENGDFFGNGVNPSAFSALSIRGNVPEEHGLPSCAPPNLFFPASGTSTAAAPPPAKREKTNASSTASSAINIENALKVQSSCVDKPYKCPAPGCDKAYKQMNGLKYHRLHGHCNQNNLPIQTQAAQAAGQLAPVVLPSKQAPGSTTASPAASKANSPNADGSAEDSSLANVTTPPSMPPSPIMGGTAASSPAGSTSPATNAPAPGGIPLSDRLYICQVGACGKRYKNLNGLRYHYLHSGQHGLLGMQLLQSGGGSSAKVDATGRAPVSTATLSSEEIAAAAQAAQAAQEQMQAAAAKSAAATAASAAAAANNGNNARA